MLPEERQKLYQKTYKDGQRQTLKTTINLALSIIPVAVVAYVGYVVTKPNVEGWYRGIAKPVFTPPDWIFSPAWMVIYLLMILACYRLLRAPESNLKSWALTLFSIQLILNGLWSPTFFGMHNPFYALIIIALLWISIIVCTAVFSMVDKLASACFVPYLLWVSFASALNFEIWRLN
jgi:benzodiazapine receptor